MTIILKKLEKKLKLFLLFWRRIVFAENHFGVPLWRRLLLNFSGGYVADQAVIYDFKHNDKKQYLSEFDWYKSRYINEPFDAMLNNKLICSEVFKHYLDFPETLFVKNKKQLINYRSPEHTIAALLAQLKDHAAIYIKPINLGKGNGVHLLEFIDGSFYMDREEATPATIIATLSKMQNWFATPGIKQAPYLNAIYEKTSNTIRMITVKDPTTQCFKVLFAVQRIGVKASIPVDNGSRGGLISKIDLETGVLSAARSIQSLGEHARHPDSQNPIEGVKIPHWQEMVQEILEASNQFPYLNFIGWDILPNDQGGLSVVEANTSSGINIIQIWGPQRDGELGAFYRSHGVIK